MAHSCRIMADAGFSLFLSSPSPKSWIFSTIKLEKQLIPAGSWLVLDFPLPFPPQLPAAPQTCPSHSFPSFLHIFFLAKNPNSGLESSRAAVAFPEGFVWGWNPFHSFGEIQTAALSQNAPIILALLTSGNTGIPLSNPNDITEIQVTETLPGSAGTQIEFYFIWVIREVPVTLGEIFPDHLLLSEVKNIILSCRNEILTQADVGAAAALGVIFHLFVISIICSLFSHGLLLF